MFGRKARENRALASRNKVLEAMLEGVGPYLGIAEEILREVKDQAESSLDIDQLVDNAVAKQRTVLYETEVNRLVVTRTAERIAAEKARIEQEAAVEADKLAAAALRRFMTEGGAEAYRDEVGSRLCKAREEAALREARRSIVGEEMLADIARSGNVPLQAKTDMPPREELKARAQELRNRTKITRFLRFGELQNGDPLTVCFTEPDKGFEPLTASDSWGTSTYRSDLEIRKLSGFLIDTTTGLFEVEKDIWAKDKMNPNALRGGAQVMLLADDPLIEGDDFIPCIAKGQPLSIQTIGKEALPQSTLDVWWVNLGDFRVLS